MTSPEDKRRFDELVPFYVSGALGAAERAWVEAYLAREPGARAELAWHQALAGAIEERVASVPEDVGLAGLQARLAAERRGARPGRLLAALERWLPRAALYPAFAGAAAIVLVQALAIALLLGREAPEFAETRAVGESQPRVYLQVNFKPEATEREIRLALIRAGGRIVHGPGQLGDYYVAVPGERLDAARRDLEASGVVETVGRVDKLPAREE
jgi:anti-sigma-K factor RskA